MKQLSYLAIIMILAAVAGCTDPDHYPISGQECSPDDPVLDMDAADCMPPV
ncbi:MAG: hypothetical protein AAFU41_03555 [Pseudomonadota bacterium]